MAKTPAKKHAYALEVKGPPTPTYIYGDVSYLDKEKSYKLIAKRPRTSKIDEFIIPESDVMIACEGEAGYIYTKNPHFDTFAVNLTLTDGVIEGDFISGFDENGNTVSVNRKLFPVDVRKVAYDV